MGLVELSRQASSPRFHCYFIITDTFCIYLIVKGQCQITTCVLLPLALGCLVTCLFTKFNGMLFMGHEVYQ